MMNSSIKFRFRAPPAAGSSYCVWINWIWVFQNWSIGVCECFSLKTWFSLCDTYFLSDLSSEKIVLFFAILDLDRNRLDWNRFHESGFEVLASPTVWLLSPLFAGSLFTVPGTAPQKATHNFSSYLKNVLFQKSVVFCPGLVRNNKTSYYSFQSKGGWMTSRHPRWGSDASPNCSHSSPICSHSFPIYSHFASFWKNNQN